MFKNVVKYPDFVLFFLVAAQTLSYSIFHFTLADHLFHASCYREPCTATISSFLPPNVDGGQNSIKPRCVR